jgi:EAL domain-containing protein (putative c-di-GMP-specific phosphodiesterase class I)/FixJ family two-component response regulator
MTDGTDLRILILDDDHFMLKLLSRMLAKQGWRDVVCCDTARAALREMDHRMCRPGLIICDLQMPGMDGIEFIRELVRLDYAGSVLLVSGMETRILQTAEKLVRAHDIKLLGYLSKPVQASELAALMLDVALTAPTAPPRRIGQYTAEALQAALAECQLVNFYQPEVSTASTELVGLDTLVRWQHPTDGLLMPDQFIGLAEGSGLIAELTAQVLRQALEQLSRWHQAGMTARISVNVSMDNLTALDFPDMVERQLHATGLRPEQLMLEITESRLSMDMRATLDILARLRLKGVLLSIDDFGTGHSSLAQLHDLPFNQLKIDKGFVHHAWLDTTTHAIFGASLGVARQLGIESVAEGVEDLDDWNFVCQSGCMLAQGYFIARPMPADEVEPWLDRWKNRSLSLQTS